MNKNIVIKNLFISFQDSNKNKLNILKGVSTEFKAGKINAIVGESGCGKSILAMSILRLLSENANIEGEIFYEGKNLLVLREKEMQKIRGKEISLIPQNPSDALNPMLKIKKQLYEIINKLKNKNLDKNLNKLLKKIGFEDSEQVKNKYPFQLSGGMQQRIVSLFGLGANPKWIIADEPTKGLDYFLKEQVYDFFLETKKNKKVSMIIITHDISLAIKVADYLTIMNNGEIIEEGPAKEVFDNPFHEYTKILFDSLPSREMKYKKYTPNDKATRLINIAKNRKLRVSYDKT